MARPGPIWLGLAAVVVASSTLAACGSGSTGSSATSTSTAPATSAAPVRAARCLVRLHGKGGTGADPALVDGRAELSPTGNADGWGARQWIYFPADRYAEALGVVAAAVDASGCTTVVVDGFSNGASFAASLFCHGETFAGRLRGVVVDDPVPDASATGCAPAASVAVAVYWTGALTQATPGASCAPLDWTCAGGSLVGIDAYAAALGAPVQASPNTTHEWYRDPPEIATWLAPA
ncbi:MAG: hypothetical protein JWM12_376 [Ilumatobacteraceae bacterium]|nr:hypothetical protein [Ilumatobacteraceae bacterium]